MSTYTCADARRRLADLGFVSSSPSSVTGFPASLTENIEAQEIVDFLNEGPKAFWEIRRYLYDCCCSESRSRTTADLLDALVAAGIVECVDGLYQGKTFRRWEG